MAQYRKKLVVIEASQWFKNGDHPLDYIDDKEDPLSLLGGTTYTADYRREHDWEGDAVRRYRNPDDSGLRDCQHCGARMHDHGWIDTLEGGHTVCPGDWIITGVNGEVYPCKDDVFKKTYEPYPPTVKETVEHIMVDARKAMEVPGS